MSGDLMDDKMHWPLWLESATKGDLITALLYQRAATAHLGAAIVALLGGDEAEARERMAEYFEEDQTLSDEMNRMGGIRADGE